MAKGHNAFQTTEHAVDPKTQQNSGTVIGIEYWKYDGAGDKERD